jgi:hypothetical protein
VNFVVDVDMVYDVYIFACVEIYLYPWNESNQLWRMLFLIFARFGLRISWDWDNA